MKTTTTLVLLSTIFIAGLAQAPQAGRQQFIRTSAPLIALTNVTNSIIA